MQPDSEEPIKTEFPSEGRLAGVDFGTVRIGISICDPDRILASPLEIHPAENWRDDGDYFRELVRLEKISGFVVGLPIHCDGGEKCAECRDFAKWLAEETSTPVRLFDERFTTADAKRRMMAGGYTRGKEKNGLMLSSRSCSLNRSWKLQDITKNRLEKMFIRTQEEGKASTHDCIRLRSNDLEDDH